MSSGVIFPIITDRHPTVIKDRVTPNGAYGWRFGWRWLGDLTTEDSIPDFRCTIPEKIFRLLPKHPYFRLTGNCGIAPRWDTEREAIAALHMACTIWTGMYKYANFLDDEAEYAASEAMWIKLWDEVEGKEGWITPWLNNPFKDGNPIFSAYHPEKQRAIRIVQHPPGHDDTEVLPIIGTMMEGKGKELLIFATAGKIFAEHVGFIMHKWLHDEDFVGRKLEELMVDLKSRKVD